jgi:hypothetical protein
MPDAHKNFAVSTVATAPSPATSGTSLVVASGHGTRFPAVPFNATIWPASGAADPTNAEIVRVTNISTDTFTITRAQESSSARTVVVGDRIAATITAKTLTDVEDPATTGWVDAGETWTYGSADDPTYTFTISGDKTTKYSAGMRVRVSQSTGGTKYFFMTKVEHSAGTTTVTIYGGTDYDLNNEAISSPYYSMVKAPFGFPLEHAKWTVEVTDSTQRSQSSPVNGTWYNLGSVTISVPIGSWRVMYEVQVEVDRTTSSTGQEAFTTLSTANNSEVDKAWTGMTFSADAAASGKGTSSLIHREKFLTLTSKTSYFLNTMQDTGGTILYNRGDICITVLRAVCAYL